MYWSRGMVVAKSEKNPNASEMLSPGGVTHADVGDVIFYLRHHNNVSGIQRVICGLIKAASEPSSQWARAIKWSAIDPLTGQLMAIKDSALFELIDLLSSASVSRQQLNTILDEITSSWSQSSLKVGDTYLLLGAFWVFNNASYTLGTMQRQGLRTGVLVYDLIPITHPEYCESSLTQVFTRQMKEILRHVDFALTISAHVASELKRYMEQERLAAIPVSPVLLAHQIDAAQTGGPLSERVSEVIGQSFVLSVGTIEVRKNHQYLVNIWRQLIRDHGRENVPTLVLVGRVGWRVSDLVAQLESTHYLDGKVVILSDVTDSDLVALYEKSLFTTFVSFVEGWGLPVGESLARGKVCVASKTSSIPEVGEDSAIYIDPFNVTEGVSVFSKLIYERGALAVAEASVASRFKLRSWAEVGEMLVDAMEQIFVGAEAPAPRGFITIPQSAWMSVGESNHEDDGTGRHLAFLACTQGWHVPEAWGRWASAPVAKLQFQSTPNAEFSVIIEMKMPPWMSGCDVRISTLGRSDVVFKRVLSEASSFCVTANSDADGSISLDIETVGGFIKAEARSLYVGLCKVMFYERTDALAMTRGLEQIALASANIRTW